MRAMLLSTALGVLLCLLLRGSPRDLRLAFQRRSMVLREAPFKARVVVEKVLLLCAFTRLEGACGTFQTGIGIQSVRQGALKKRL